MVFRDSRDKFNTAKPPVRKIGGIAAMKKDRIVRKSRTFPQIERRSRRAERSTDSLLAFLLRSALQST